MSDFTIGDRVDFGNGTGEIIKIEGDQADGGILHILSADGELKKLPAGLPHITVIESSEGLLAKGEFADPRHYDLRQTALELSANRSYDRFVALPHNRIKIEPYQVKAVHEVLSSYDHRYLIADEVGLGKTIEAAMVIEELAARDRADRVLIVTPAPLQQQWQEELREKFGQEFVIYDREFVETQQNAHPSQNAWMQEDRIITSVDFAKQADIRDALGNLSQEWDIAVFDESHHLTARREGQAGIEKTQRYRLGEVVSRHSDGLLFLTGTPHNGKRDQFYFMLKLLDPYRFEDEDHITPDGLRNLMIRRLKSNMTREDGSQMFPEKEIRTLPVTFTQAEQALYEDVTEYISEHFNRGGSSGSNVAGFAMAVYQKRLVSSVYAIRKSIENRIQALSGGGADGKLSKLVQQLLPKYRRDPEMLTDQAREQVERELEQVSFTDNPEELEQELEILEELRDQARQVRVDSKAQKLQEFVNGILESDPDEKILIFTEYTDTLEYLRDEVFSSYRTAEIYGDLGQSQRRKQVERFEEEANLMLATDAAREGLNLQFAHIMVNYDLPWNPNRIDQRIGRLHRYGQDETVKIHNLFVDETRESEILERLLEKIDEIESQLGLSSDILGLVLDDFNLEDEIMTAVASHKEVDDVIEEVEQHISTNQADVTAAQEQLTAAEHGSDEAETKKIRELIARSEENTVLGDEVRQLLQQFFAEFGGTLRKETGTGEPVLFHVEPPKILRGNSVDAVYEQVTFDRETAVENPKSEFMSIEHELVEALLAFCSDEERAGGLTTVKTAAIDEPTPGIFFTFRLECIDGVGDVVAEELFQTYITLDGEPHDLPEFTGGLPAEQAKSSEPVNSVIEKHEELRDTAVAVAQTRGEELRATIAEDREKAIETRIENTKAYFDAREERLNADLESYQEQDKQDDKDMSALINKRRRQLEDINSEREQVLAQLETKQVVACEEPKLVSIAVVVDGLN